jgi:hypothetical protein
MIFTAPDPQDFTEVETFILDAFHRSQQAARDGEAMIFVLSNEHLLGQNGAPGAILANALLSGMRTLAAEGHQANAIAVGAEADAEDLQYWIGQLEHGRGVNGELVHVHAKHVGKANS